MEVSEYRTIKSRGAGADRGADGQILGQFVTSVTGWDMGCLTLEFYVNILVGH